MEIQGAAGKGLRMIIDFCASMQGNVFEETALTQAKDKQWA